MNSLDKQYQDLLQDILDNGVVKGDRTGTGTKSVFGRTIRHKMSEGFPILTTKSVHFKSVATELLWFLRGDTNIKWLVDNNCNIWTGDAYKRYADSHYTPGDPNGTYLRDQLSSLRPIEHSKKSFTEEIKDNEDFAAKWGDLGPIYGKQWREWDNGYKKIETNDPSNYTIQRDHIDQISNLINDLKTNPDSRRLMVTAWNPAEIDAAVLPPCHYGFQCWTRELSLEERRKLASHDSKFISPITIESWGMNNVPRRAISLKWDQRSVDTLLGLPFNIASYGLLLHILAKLVNMVPEDLIGNLGDTHLYSNHFEQAKEQISRDSFDLPKLDIIECPITGFDLDYLSIGQFKLVDYQHHEAIKAPLSN